MVMENGMSDGNGTNDDARIDFIYRYGTAMLTAMYDYGCDVRSYSYWSLLDSFEWSDGYT